MAHLDCLLNFMYYIAILDYFLFRLACLNPSRAGASDDRYDYIYR